MKRPLTHCLAYGSNLHPYRMSQRVPSAQPVGVVRLSELRLTFHKTGQDGSAKCMFAETGAGTDEMYCVVYQMHSVEKSTLDRLEGLGNGYNEQQMSVVANGTAYKPSIYVAAATHISPHLAPFHWYKEMVILGAHFHRLPESYVGSIRAIDSCPDPDSARALSNEKILESMRTINEANGCATT